MTVTLALGVQQMAKRNAITRKMAERGEPIGIELEKALAEGKVKYEKVHARIGKSGGKDALKDVRVSEFDLAP